MADLYASAWHYESASIRHRTVILRAAKVTAGAKIRAQFLDLTPFDTTDRPFARLVSAFVEQLHADVGGSESESGPSRGLPDVGDDRLNAPRVTPVPAPPDDQLVRLFGAGAIAAGLLAIVVAWWLRRNVSITRR